MEKEQRSVSLQVEIRSEEESPKKITGYAVKWNERSSPIFGMFEEQFQRGAFSEAIQDSDIIAAWNHNFSEILGRTPTTLTLQEDEIGLRYEIIPPSWADKYIETIQRGDVKGSSFTFIPEVEEWDESGKMALRTIKKAKLYEVSPVIFPAYPTSEAGVRSAEAIYNNYVASKKEENPDYSYEEKLLELQEKV